VSFDVGSLPGLRRDPAAGQVDYRLARQHVVNEFRRGRLSRRDICDAHPELLRAAGNVAAVGDEPCPICEGANLVLVSFAFGPRLPPGGRCILTAKDMAQLRRRPEDATCYVVEVCTDCGWNHLRSNFPLARHRAPRSR